MTSGIVRFWNILGHPAQGVVVLLGLMSVLSIGIVVERGVTMWVARRDSRRFVPLAQAAFQTGLIGETLPLAESCALSPEADLVRRSGVDLESAPEAEWQANRRFLLARWGIDRHLTSLDLELRQGLPILGTIAATAPFVGLFGTVLGIIRAFDSLGTTGGGLASVSQGIAEALITTALGLFVAIPATWAYNFLRHRVDGAVFRARHFSGVFLEALAATGGTSTRRLLLREPESAPAPIQFSSSNIRSDINVTPLVDVVLVLLIIFMVLTPAPEMALDLGISRTVQAGAGREEKKKDQVFLRLTAASQVYLNDEEISPGQLKGRLQSSFKGKEGEPLFFEADPAADYTRVVQILDECSSAGVGNIAIVSRKSHSP